jgi:hypothetical protein
MRTNPLVLHQFDLVHDFAAAGTLLEKTVRNVALLAILRLHCWFFENSHVNYARAAVAA